MPVVACPECEQRLRIPDGKRGTVVCPRCGADWFYSDTAELSSVEFKCSKNVAPFSVILGRLSPHHDFRIERITTSLPAQDAQSRTEEQVPSKATVGTKLMNWFGIQRKAVAPTVYKGPAEEPATDLPVTRSTRDFDEYDWDGFECPYCHTDGFVSCADGHLVCDSSVEIREGKRFHACYCGIDGFLEEDISTIKCKFVSVERPQDSPQNAALPKPNSGHLLPSRTTFPTKR